PVASSRETYVCSISFCSIFHSCNTLREFFGRTAFDKFGFIGSPLDFAETHCPLQCVQFQSAQVFLCLIAEPTDVLFLDMALFNGSKSALFKLPQLNKVSGKHRPQLIKGFHLPPPLTVCCSL